MARRKTLPESVRAKLALAERLGALRLELFGDRGGPEMARRLAIPVRTWYNYEGGVTVPAEVVLKIIELTSVEPAWLLHGKGPKFRHDRLVAPRRGVTVGDDRGRTAEDGVTAPGERGIARSRIERDDEERSPATPRSIR